MNGVEAEVEDYREQYRRRKDDDADVVHQHSHEYEEEVDHHHDDDRVRRDGVEEVQDAARQVFKDVEAREHRDGVEHDHDDARRDGAFDYDVEEPSPGKSLVDVKSYRDAVEDGKGGGFGRRHDAAVDSAENHEGHDERRNREASALHEHVHALLAGALDFDKDFLIVAKHPDVDDAEEGYSDEARSDRRKEAGEDGDAAYPGEDDERRVRRDEESEQRGVGHKRAGVAHRVSALLETREHDGSDAGERRAGSSADGAEHGAGDDGDDAESAADMSDEDVDHVDELFSDASALHDAAGEDEHRYRYQRNRVHLREAVRQKLRRGISGSVRAAEEDQPRAGGHEADGNGNAYRKAEYKYYKRYVNHLFLPPKSAFPALIVSQRK